MKRLRFKAVLIFLLLSGIPWRLVSAKESKVSLDNQIDSLFIKMKMTGLGIAVVKGDSIVYVNSFGYRER